MKPSQIDLPDKFRSASGRVKTIHFYVFATRAGNDETHNLIPLFYNFHGRTRPRRRGRGGYMAYRRQAGMAMHGAQGR